MGSEPKLPVFQIVTRCNVRSFWAEWDADNNVRCFRQRITEGPVEQIPWETFWEESRRLIASDLSTPAGFERLEFLDVVKGAVDGNKKA